MERRFLIPSVVSPGRDQLYPVAYGSDETSTELNIGFEDLQHQLQQSDYPRNGSINDDPEQVPKNTLLFDDQKRRIDYVLAYDDSNDDEKKKARRQMFEDNLMKKGLQLEYTDRAFCKTVTYFVKVHATWDVLCQYAEFLHMKMPLAPNDIADREDCFSKFPNPFELDPNKVKPEKNYFTAPFHQERIAQYVMDSDSQSGGFFTPAQRSRIVYEILSRATFEGEDKRRKYGIKRLLGSSYTAAYPLHEGEYWIDDFIYVDGFKNDRHLLYEMWASPKMWYKYQPLDIIRKYFGEKIGIYFSWLAFYTRMLIPAAMVGLAVFIYGLATMMDDVPSSDICDNNKAGNLTMCPLCDELCYFWQLNSVCMYARTSYLMDNPATIFFAAFMSLWSVFFIELWKRQQNEIGYDWDVSKFEEEEETVRPEFDTTVTTTRENPVTETEEPYVPFKRKLFHYSTSIVVILLMLCLVIGAVIGVIIYRIVIIAVFAKDAVLREKATIATSMTASVLNLIVILVLNQLYKKLAYGLTELEKPRTQTEWEDGFTLKMFLFQFVNYYSSIFYIAFIKGRIVGSPNKYIYFHNERLEECSPSGCLVELCIQLGVVMVGKQAFNNFVELLWPKILNWFQSRYIRNATDCEETFTQWETDYLLTETNALGMFYEYLEMVIQFGFVTIFVAAFPLAPLFALLNNIIEIRLDAYKYVSQFRRPLATRVQDIGMWYGILKGVCIISVISNAFIISVTSDFIPKMMYKMTQSPTNNLVGYVNFSLSYFNVADFPNRSKPNFLSNVTECRYKAFRYPPDSPHKYEYTVMFWHILAARMAFVIAFENVILLLAWLLAAIIPDVPSNVKMQMLRENFLTKRALLSFEDEKRERRTAKSEVSKQD